MNKRLQSLYDALENDRLRLLKKVEGLSFEALNRAPAGQWSIHQVLSHLIAAERLSLLYIAKKMQGADAYENTGVREGLVMLLLRLSQRFPFKFKAPAVVVQHSTIYPDYDTLKKDWEKRRTELKNLLEKIPDSHLRKKVYKHVRAGMLNIQQAVAFFREHSIHHGPQIERLLRAVSQKDY